MLRGEESDDEVRRFLSAGHNLTSSTITNEIQQRIATVARDNVIALVAKSPFWAFLADEAVDIKRASQHAIFVRVYDEERGAARELFFKIASNPGDADAPTITDHLEDMSRRLEPYWCKCACVCSLIGTSEE